jgi:Spy/CpxP family protein refolding chaperone
MKTPINRAVLGMMLSACTLLPQIASAEPASPAAPTPARTESNDQDGGGHRGGGRWKHRGERFGKKLNLTADQKEKLKGLRQGMRARLQPVREQLRTKSLELKVLWRSESPDRAAILAKMQEMDGLKKQLREARVDMRLGMHLILTPTQRIQMEEMHKGRGGRHHRFGRGRGGRHFGE